MKSLHLIQLIPFFDRQAAVDFSPIVSKQIVGDNASEAVSDDDDSVVDVPHLAASGILVLLFVQLAQDINTASEDVVTTRDILRRDVEVTRGVPDDVLGWIEDQLLEAPIR